MTERPKAAIYARYSTEHQTEKSIEDQVALCSAYAAREGFEVVAVYADRAKSGGQIFGRDDFAKMMKAAEAGKFQAVIVEALDRLSRDMEDLAATYKLLNFYEVEIRAVYEGVANTVLIGLRGLVGQLYREDGADKSRRGMMGMVEKGRSPGGIPYGYRKGPAENGERIIVEEQAEVVRDIYRQYVGGASARKIAEDLNMRGVPAPRGEKWNASTISGNRRRGIGILNNALYDGRIVWNKNRMVTSPITGKRVIRTRPVEDRHTGEKEDLRILPPGLFAEAQAMMNKLGEGKPETKRRPKRLFSGLLKCGCCGSGMSVAGTDGSGRVRIRCSAHRESGTCPDPKTFYLDWVEELVLASLTAELQNPRRITRFVETYMYERRELARAARRERSTLERKIAEKGVPLTG